MTKFPIVDLRSLPHDESIDLLLSRLMLYMRERPPYVWLSPTMDPIITILEAAVLSSKSFLDFHNDSFWSVVLRNVEGEKQPDVLAIGAGFLEFLGSLSEAYSAAMKRTHYECLDQPPAKLWSILALIKLQASYDERPALRLERGTRSKRGYLKVTKFGVQVLGITGHTDLANAPKNPFIL